MRVWVGPHVSATGDVTAPNYIYSRVDSTAAGTGASITRRFEPLTGRSDPLPAVEARPIEVGDLVVTAEPGVAVENHEVKTSRPGLPMTTNNVRVAEIYFESGDATVSTRGRNRLTDASSRIAELKPRAVLVAGFTDRVGSAEANQRLAKRRVDAVIEILRDLGVTAAILDAAQGEPETLNPGPDGAADPNSRKVWVVALDVAPEPRPAAAVESEGQSPPHAAADADAPAEQKTSFLTRWLGGASTASPGAARGCRLCRDPDDHGDSDDRDHAAKDHDPGMMH
jgi:outer membrane protein OmpA-like peptidoglycan-associated protein